MEKYLIVKSRDSEKRAKVEAICIESEEESDEAITEDELDHSKSLKQKTATSFTTKEVKGNLFECPSTESLVHCISEDVRMGKGIAKIFKEKFGGTKELLSQGVTTGGVAVLKRGSRYIYYMVTKKKYWNKPTYNSLQSSLQATADHCQSHGVRALSMPRIGCGLDGLKWDRVVQIIREIFQEANISVTVYTL